MTNFDVSVVLTTYNQDLNDILMSCASVMLQRGVFCELIVADDASNENKFQDIESFLKRNFPGASVRFVSHSENVKTVKNLLDGISNAQGRYTKELGAGDLLYDYSTLSSLIACAKDNSSNAVFGKINCFMDSERGYLTSCFNAPRNACFYSQDVPCVKQAMVSVINADWIPGSAQFYRTDLYEKLLFTLSNDYKVKYCEDFAGVLSLIDRPFSFLNHPILWYKLGDGISTNGSKASRKRMYLDHSNFYSGLRQSRLSNEPGFIKAGLGFKIRKFAALHTPMAAILQKMVANSYQSESNESVQLTELFKESAEMVNHFVLKLK